MRILFIGIGILVALGTAFMAWALVKVGAESDRRSEEFYRNHIQEIDRYNSRNRGL